MLEFQTVRLVQYDILQYDNCLSFYIMGWFCYIVFLHELAYFVSNVCTVGNYQCVQCTSVYIG